MNKTKFVMKKNTEENTMLYIDTCSLMAIISIKQDWYPYLAARNILENEYKRNSDSIEYSNYFKARDFVAKKLDNDYINEIYTLDMIELFINEAINMMYKGEG